MAMDGAQVKFVGGGSQSVGTLHVKGRKSTVGAEEQLSLL